MESLLKKIGCGLFGLWLTVTLVETLRFYWHTPSDLAYVAMATFLGGLAFIGYRAIPPKPRGALRRNIYLLMFLSAVVCDVAVLAGLVWIFLGVVYSAIPNDELWSLLGGAVAVSATIFGLTYVSWREWRDDCRTNRN